MSVGHCRTYKERWFYDVTNQKCEPFGYTGCGGNANNFRDKEDCARACSNVTARTTVPTSPATTPETDIVTKKTKPTPPHVDNEVMQNDAPADDRSRECKVGPWLGWSECFGDCDYAIKLNYRLVTRTVSGAGVSCPRVVKSRTCRPPHCRNAILTAQESTAVDSGNTSP
ncbi:hypothetical protein O0L34_g8985 [Tuta absoluta]|nr:hypothetical protein O0L34_g8985 [Tuta absoluta]